MNAIHPGAYLGSTYATPLGLSAGELAKLLDVPVDTIHRLLWQDTPLTADLAVRLETLFDKPAIEWLTLQMKFDLECAWAAEESGTVSRYPGLNRLWVRGFPSNPGHYYWRAGPGERELSVELMFETYRGNRAALVRCYQTTSVSIEEYGAGEWRCK